MSVTQRLVFDVTDSDTIAASSNVGAFVRSSDGTLIDHQTIASTEWLQVASALFAGDGTAITQTGGALDVNITNSLSVALDGVYDGGSNTDPDNVGLIAHVRDASPADSHQTFRSTGGAASSDDVVAANVFGLDVNAFGMVFDGTTWDRLRGTGGAMHVSDAGGSLTVDATDLDIRDLSAASDSVAAWLSDGSGNALSSTGGALHVDIQDALVTVSDAALANTAVSNEANGVANVEEDLVGSVLSNRKYLYTYNNGNKAVYLGATGVTSANGFPMYPGMGYEFRAGASITMRAIAQDASSQDVRILQLS